jgi:hypothetical protein
MHESFCFPEYPLLFFIKKAKKKNEKVVFFRSTMYFSIYSAVVLISGILPAAHSYQTWWQKPLAVDTPITMPTSDDGLFGGIATFAHIPYEQCWRHDATFDIAFVGAPFDTCMSKYCNCRV